MTRVICAEDCGNAPKKLLLKELHIALAKNETDSVLDHVTNDVIWHNVGGECVQGKASFAEALQEMNREATELNISYIITHGKTAAANGTLKFEAGNDYAFCDVYTFNSAGKIKEITSYKIELKSH